MGLVGSAVLVAEPLPDLHHNPFKRPALIGVGNPNNKMESAEKPTGKELDLRAVVADGRASMVNVNGQFVRIGEQVEGYRLISVQEGSAVFERQAQQVTVPVWREELNQDTATSQQY